jgi:hypothetical protein
MKLEFCFWLSLWNALAGHLLSLDERIAAHAHHRHVKQFGLKKKTQNIFKEKQLPNSSRKGLRKQRYQGKSSGKKL